MTEENNWIWGRHSVLEALRAGKVRRILLAPGRAPSSILGEIRTKARDHAVSVTEMALPDLERTVRSEHTQGVAAQVASPLEFAVADLFRASGPSGFLLALDQVQDPHNLGALLRTADAVGVDGVILPARRTAPLSGTVAKTSAGAMHHVRIARAPNLARAFQDARLAGYWIIGLDGGAEQTVFQMDFTVPLILTIGSEGSGLRRLTRTQCDFLARVPMLGEIESLNAAVAGSVAMYEAARQRWHAGAMGRTGQV